MASAKNSSNESADPTKSPSYDAVTSRSDDQPAVRTSVQCRCLDRLCLVLAGIVACSALWRVLTVVAWHLSTPYDLVFESPNLSTIQSIAQGANVYDRAIYNAPPFHFTMYTPLYHRLCSWLPQSGSNPFLTGRVVALGFIALSGLTICWAGKWRNWTFVWLGIGLFCALRPVVSNAAFLKNDSTALFFSVLAVLTVRHASGVSGRLAGVALCCVLALAAKQTFVSASAACFIYLLITRRRDALYFGLYYLLFAVLGALVAQTAWGDGFWYCTAKAPQAPIEPGQFAEQWKGMLRQPVFILLNGFWILALMRYGLLRRIEEKDSRIFIIYFILSEMILILTVGKPGSSTNYFIESCLAGIFWLVSMGPALAEKRVFQLALTLTCLGAVAWELTMARPSEYSFSDPGIAAWRKQLHHELASVGGSYTPTANPLRVLNLASASTYYDWPGEVSVNDPYLYSLLWERGALDPEPMLNTIRRQAYDLVVMRKNAAGLPKGGNNGMSRIMTALHENYAWAKNGSVFEFWTPILSVKPNGAGGSKEVVPSKNP